MSLINREMLLEEYDRAHKGPPGGARKLIAEAPTIDAEPVRHGKWKLVDDDSNCWECTCCGDGWILEAGNPSDNGMMFCPHCGADMRGASEDAGSKTD